jgi:hypothetical protein
MHPPRRRSPEPRSGLLHPQSQDAWLLYPARQHAVRHPGIPADHPHAWHLLLQ